MSIIDNIIDLETDARTRILNLESPFVSLDTFSAYKEYYTDVGYIRCTLTRLKNGKIRATWKLNDLRIKYAELRELFNTKQEKGVRKCKQ